MPGPILHLGFPKQSADFNPGHSLEYSEERSREAYGRESLEVPEIGVGVAILKEGQVLALCPSLGTVLRPQQVNRSDG